MLVFFLFFYFWCFMPKGEKIRGVNNFFDAVERRLLQLESCLYPFRVVFVRREFESLLETLFM